jgi:hypothetical protein
MILRRATERLREVGSLPLLLTALLIAGSVDLSAQDRSRSRANDSSGPSRQAEPRADSGPRHAEPRPSAPSTPSTPSAPPRSASPSSPSDSDSDSGSASPSSPSRRRHAVPGSPGEPSRQPSYRDRNDPDRGYRGDRYYYNHYYPRWYSYYGGPGWWWAPYGYWGWFWWGQDSYYGNSYYGEPYYRGGRGYSDRNETGALDLDVSPGRTQVYLDGQYIGTVDQYDGFPTFLWLEKGTYDIAFFLDGYKTVARQVSVYPGTVIDFDDRLEPGASVRPEDLATKTHDRRDDRVRFEEERRERIERGEEPSDEDWRSRVRRDREDRRDRGEGIEYEVPEDRMDRDDRETPSERSEQGRVRLEVEPDDASIYLDGKFVGTAQDLASLRRGLLVEPGEHTVAVVRPGRESVERKFEVEAGEELDLEIELEPSGR